MTKAIVVSNCATRHYAEALEVLFPAWTVKGVQVDLASEWLAADKPNPNFLRFLGEVDYYIGTPLTACANYLRPDVSSVVIPAFGFRGLHPDSFHLASHTSVLGSGNLFSRIACAAYLTGCTEAKTIALFRREIYESLGYFDVFELDKATLLRLFAAHNIDLSSCFENWTHYGNFLYTYSHPKLFVLSDIFVEAMVGILGDSVDSINKLQGLDDYLGQSIIWPVYPEIAEGRMTNEKFVWRKGAHAGFTEYDLPGFVAETFRVLRETNCITGSDVPNLQLIADVIR